MRLIEHNGIWVLALAVGVTAYWAYRRRLRHSRGRVDANAEQLYSEIARKLSEQMDAPPEQILAVLRGEAASPAEGKTPPPLHMECTFRKLNASSVEIMIIAAYFKDGKPVTSSFRRELSWDDIPSDVRREFIHTGKIEMHYGLGMNTEPSST